MTFPGRPWCLLLAAICAASCLFCSRSSLLNPLPYEPPFVFSGYFKDGDQFSWPGNKEYPNHCDFLGDTVVMYFCSEDFGGRNGDQLRLEIFRVDSEYITTHGAIFHLARYSSGPTTVTYVVVPADTAQEVYSLSMKIKSFAKQSGAAVELTNIAVAPQAIGMGQLPLAIMNGTITGTLE
jgi:hypothetical protein